MLRVGASDLLKEGSKTFSGLDEAVIKNIEMCKQLSTITRSSYGPNGMNKLVINHLEKTFVTSDAATIMKEMEIVHPAAKMVGFAADQMEKEHGDTTNFVVCFAGELLAQAENLIREGLHVSEIISGYTKASRKAQEEIKSLACATVVAEDFRDAKKLARFLKAVIASKQYGVEDLLCRITAEACVSIMPRNLKAFNVDNVRVCKILGGSVSRSEVVQGLVLTRDTEGTIKHVKDAKVCVFNMAIDTSATETKGTVLMKNAEDVMSYNLSEEKAMEAIIKSIADTGAKIVVSGGAIGEMALHFIERYGMMAVKVLSKFDMRRLCKAVGATGLARLGAPTPEEMGHCQSAGIEEIGGTRCVVFRNTGQDGSKVVSIVVRGSTQNSLDDTERAIDDAVNVVKAYTKDGQLCPGGGATEVELARRVQKFGETCPGLDQYSVKKFAEAFEVFPRTLAENAGFVAADVISSLYAAHEEGKQSVGVDIEGSNDESVTDLAAKDIFDHLAGKSYAIKLATDAAITVLRVDQIIMAKPAGGPKQ